MQHKPQLAPRQIHHRLGLTPRLDFMSTSLCDLPTIRDYVMLYIHLQIGISVPDFCIADCGGKTGMRERETYDEAWMN